MLQIVIPGIEGWDEEKQEFVQLTKPRTLQMEHSLVSLSKWESKWCKAFFSGKEKTAEEILDYVKCMTITQNVAPEIYNDLTSNNIEQIKNYIEAPMTALRFFDNKQGKQSREPVTAELIYYWMIALNIPFECQKWHINRLMALIKICKIKSQPPKKGGTSEILARNAALNEARKQQLNTKG